MRFSCLCCSKTAIAIDTIINQKRFNDGDDESKSMAGSCVATGLDACLLLLHREEALLYICCHWTEEEYSGSDRQTAFRFR